MEEMENRIAELEAEVKRLRTLATDRRYMMDAYRAMLGPKGLAVVERWEKNGVTRQHTYWGPDAANLTGEERAQVLIDAESAARREVPFLDGVAEAR